MNRLFLAAMSALLVLCQFTTRAAGTDAPKDTILLKLKKADKLMIITSSKNQVGVRGLTEYDLNQIVRQVDSVLRSTNAVAYTKDGRGEFRLKDTTITMSTRPGADRKEQNTDIRMSIGRDSARNITIRFTDKNSGQDTAMVVKKKKPKHPYGDLSDLYLNVGLDNWISRQNGKFPDAEGLPHGLRPGGSRYVALGATRYFPLARTKYAPALTLGAEIAWYNYMLSDNRYGVSRGANAVAFDTIARRSPFAGKDINVIKSKLTQSVIKVPVGIRFKLPHNSSIELGGYAGYRLGSHSKVKYVVDGDTKKDKERDNFYLNNFQYGLRAKIEVYGIGIFGEYGLQPVFGKGPDLRNIAFGISL